MLSRYSSHPASPRRLILLFVLLVTTIAVSLSLRQSNPALVVPSTSDVETTPVFREPFLLRVRVGIHEWLETQVPRTPFVADGTVYIFPGEAFSVHVVLPGIGVGKAQSVTYAPNATNANLHLRFMEESQKDGSPMPMLHIQNGTRATLYFDGILVRPDARPERTSILPIEAGKSGYEVWYHPIAQLALQNIRARQ